MLHPKGSSHRAILGLYRNAGVAIAEDAQQDTVQVHYPAAQW